MEASLKAFWKFIKKWFCSQKEECASKPAEEPKTEQPPTQPQ